MIEFVNQVNASLVQHVGSDEMVCHAAWVSNFSSADVPSRPYNYHWDEGVRQEWDKKISGLINFLWRERHTSPFEHGQFTFLIECPLFVAREFQRHRTFSFNEVSGRYKKMEPRFYMGDSARTQKGKIGSYTFEDSPELTGVYWAEKQISVETSWASYERRLEAGMAKEQAREDLPLSLMTQFYATVNPLNLMKFLSLRNDKHALKEIRDVAVQMETIFAETMPLTYAAYKRYDWRDEREELESLRKKVAQLEAELTYARFD